MKRIAQKIFSNNKRTICVAHDSPEVQKTLLLLRNKLIFSIVTIN